MLSKYALISLLTSLLIGYSGVKDNGDNATNCELKFLGTVQSIAISTIPQSKKNWIVTFKIDKVETGKFDGNSFSVRIHSPSKSGLEIGKQYTVIAKCTNSGYTVDEYQWR